MAHLFVAPPDAAALTAHFESLDQAALQEMRIDLAASFRAAAHAGLQEGICNHFSAMLPGSDQLFLVNPYGLSFAEINASDLLVCDIEGAVISGTGQPEATAFHIHARLHRHRPGARAVFHTHMPYATALAISEGEPLLWASQTALKFWGRITVDNDYSGLALDQSEGDRIAAAAGGADIVFLSNHGVLVIAPSVAEAWDDLYYLERAAQVQCVAQATGRPLKPVPTQLARATAAQIRAEDAASARLHLASVRRQLARTDPGFDQ